MRIAIAEFIEGVRATVGLPATDPDGRIGDERVRFDNVIERLGEETACEELMKGPSEYAEWVESNVVWRSAGVGYVGVYAIPEESLRTVGVVADGKAILAEATEPGSPEYWRRGSAYPEIAGDTVTPRLYHVTGPEGNSLELHRSATAGAGKIGYIRRPTWKEGALEVPDPIGMRLIGLVADKVTALIG